MNYKSGICLAVVTVLVLTLPALGRAECSSIAAASYGGWQPVSSAPRDGTTVEMLETFGVAPWYGLFKWSKTETLGGAQDSSKECDNSPDPYAQVAEEYDRSWRHTLDPVLGRSDRLPADFDRRLSEYAAKHCHDQPETTITLNKPTWVQVDKGGSSVDESECLFWRPYRGGQRYSDPTNGAQNTVAYECAYLHLPYDKESNRCLSR